MAPLALHNAYLWLRRPSLMRVPAHSLVSIIMYDEMGIKENKLFHFRLPLEGILMGFTAQLVCRGLKEKTLLYVINGKTL